MKRVCAWCRKQLGRVDSQGSLENVITHGICEKCSDNLLFQMGVELEVFLDSLKLPVVVVNREGTIVTGNDNARTRNYRSLKATRVVRCLNVPMPDCLKDAEKRCTALAAPSGEQYSKHMEPAEVFSGFRRYFTGTLRGIRKKSDY